MLDGIKTVVFDLDGTIYQDLGFHADYLRFMLEDSGKEEWLPLLKNYADEVFRGEHLKMNASYRVTRTDASTPKSLFAAMEAGLTTDESFSSAPEREERIYLGDAWAVVTYMGRCMGLLDGSRCDEVYRKTRMKMEQDGRRGNLGLREAIELLGKSRRTVLLSNSYEKTAMEFLKQLGFDKSFVLMGFSAGKPEGMHAALESLLPDALESPETVLTVGDHAFNDLMPLEALGCKTLWINPYTGINEPEYDYSVPDMDALAAFLKAMC